MSLNIEPIAFWAMMIIILTMVTLGLYRAGAQAKENEIGRELKKAMKRMDPDVRNQLMSELMFDDHKDPDADHKSAMGFKARGQK